MGEGTEQRGMNRLIPALLIMMFCMTSYSGMITNPTSAEISEEGGSNPDEENKSIGIMIGGDNGLVRYDIEGASFMAPAGISDTAVEVRMAFVPQEVEFPTQSEVLALTPHGMTFSQNITVTMEIMNSGAEPLAVYTKANDDAPWMYYNEPLNLSAEGFVSFNVTHFSYWVITERTGGETLTVGGTSNNGEGEFGCMIEDVTSRVYCWGHNTQGQTGSNPSLWDETAYMVDSNGQILHTRPTHPVMDDLGDEIEAYSISAGDQHACAIPTTDNQDRLLCWGNVPFIAQSSHIASPVTLSEMSAQMHIHSVDSGGESTCVITTDYYEETDAYCLGELASSSLTAPDFLGGDGPITCTAGLEVFDISDGLPGVCVMQPANFDNDQDGWPSNAQTTFLQSLGHTVPPMDCADSNAAIHPGAVETIDGVDQDCDGYIDEANVGHVSIHAPTQLSVGGGHACAVNRTHDVFCWGDNAWGQLGSASTVLSSSTPQQIFDVNGNAVKATAVAAGGAHTCIITSGNEVQCWGRIWDSLGAPLESSTWTVQTSDPLWEPSFTQPADYSGWETTHALHPKAIKAGNDHTCIIADSRPYGQASPTNATYCWGRNHLGQLAQGTNWGPFVDEYKPMSIERNVANTANYLASPPPSVHNLALGGDALCYAASWASSENYVRCVGNQQSAINGAGRIGSHQIENGLMDIQSAGFQQGYGQSGARMILVENTQQIDAISMLDAELATSTTSNGCALLAATSSQSLKITCFGEHIEGERTDFTPLSGIPIDVKATLYAACVLTDVGEIGCWGQEITSIASNEMCSNYGLTALNNNGIANTCLGNNHQTVQTIPLTKAATEFTVSTEGGCAALSDGSVECWGAIHRLGNRALGYPANSPAFGIIDDSNLPSSVWQLVPSGTVAAPTGQTNKEIFSSDVQDLWAFRDMCIILIGGNVQCYGGTYGVMNPNWPTDASNGLLETDMPGFIDAAANWGLTVTRVVLSPLNICLLLSDETVRCAGNNEEGQLGDGTRATTSANQDWASPVLVGVKDLFSGYRSFCANVQTGINDPLEVHCWGRITYGLPIDYHFCDHSSAPWYDALACDAQGDALLKPVWAEGLEGLPETSDMFWQWDVGCVLSVSGELECWGDDDLGKDGFLCVHDGSMSASEITTFRYQTGVFGCGEPANIHLDYLQPDPPSLAVLLDADAGQAPYQIVDQSSSIGCNVQTQVSNLHPGNIELTAKWIVKRVAGGLDQYPISQMIYLDPSSIIGSSYLLDNRMITGTFSQVDLTNPNNAIGGIPHLGDRIYCSVEATDLFGQLVTHRTTSALVVKTLYHDMDGDGQGAGPAFYSTSEGCVTNIGCTDEHLHYAWGIHKLPPSIQVYMNEGGIVDVQSNEDFSLALLDTGEVIQWGRESTSQRMSFIARASQLSNVAEIAVSDHAAAALTTTGKVVVWGDQGTGGIIDEFTSTLMNDHRTFSQIIANRNAFAALRDDGFVVAWGAEESGGKNWANPTNVNYLNDVEEIFSSAHSFAVLRTDATAYSWGGTEAALDAWETHTPTSSVWDYDPNFHTGEECDAGNVAPVLSELTNVMEIVSSDCAFAALRSDGSIVAWGEPRHGGLPDSNNNGVYDWLSGEALSTGFTDVVPTKHGFTAKTTSGATKHWPSPSNYWHSTQWDWGYGSGWPNDAECIITPESGTQTYPPASQIITNDCGWMVIYDDPLTDEWGYRISVTPYYGIVTTGNYLFNMHEDENLYPNKVDHSPIVDVTVNRHAFAVLHQDGSYLIQGDPLFGGNGPTTALPTIVNFYATDAALVGLDADGKLHRWGPEVYGEDTTNDMLNPPRCDQDGPYQSFWSERQATPNTPTTDVCPVDIIAMRGGIADVNTGYRTVLMSMDMSTAMCTGTGCTLPANIVQFSDNDDDCDDLEPTIYLGASDDPTTAYDESCVSQMTGTDPLQSTQNSIQGLMVFVLSVWVVGLMLWVSVVRKNTD